MAESDVQGALLAAADTFLTVGTGKLSAGSVSWPNIEFDPAGNAIWAAVHYVPNDPEPITLGELGQDRGTGFLQIDFCVPINTGSVALRAWENAARAYFPAGRTFAQAGQAVRVVSSGMSQLRIVDNWAKKSFTIRYRFEIQRAALP